MLLRQWEPLLLQWPLLGAAARQDLISKLASSELLFFLAVKDRPAYEEVRCLEYLCGCTTWPCMLIEHCCTPIACAWARACVVLRWQTCHQVQGQGALATCFLTRTMHVLVCCHAAVTAYAEMQAALRAELSGSDPAVASAAQPATYASHPAATGTTASRRSSACTVSVCSQRKLRGAQAAAVAALVCTPPLQAAELSGEAAAGGTGGA